MFNTLQHLGLIASIALGFIVQQTTFAQDQAGKTQQKRRSAVETMKRAHDNRGEWKDFTGFSADIAVHDQDAKLNGALKIDADGEVTIQLSDSKIAEWVRADLKSLVEHRLPTRDREYDVSFVKGEKPNALGRLIAFNDDRTHSVYRIRNNLITEVHRNMGNQKLMISVLDVQWNKERKTLPRTYTVSWTDAKTGKVTSSQLVNNRWSRVGGWDLPVRLLKIENKADGARIVREIRLTNHKLLKEE